MASRARKPITILLISISLLSLYVLHQSWSRVSLPRSLPLPLPQQPPDPDHGVPLPELLPRPLSIWLVETSGRADLTHRELCAVESAALHHPQDTVYLLLTYPTLNSTLIMELMTRYRNIQTRYLDLDTLFTSSPLSELWMSGQVHSSYWPVSHLSDLVRYHPYFTLLYLVYNRMMLLQILAAI